MKTSLSRFAAIALALASFACNDKLAVGTLAGIEWQPRALSFGETLVGSSATLDIVLKNTGSRAVVVRAIRFAAGSSPAFSISAGAISSARTMNARGTSSVTVRYAPTSTAEARGTLRAETDAGNIDAIVTNQPPAPRIELEPPALDFGVVAQGESRDREIKIRNVGTAPLRLLRIALSSVTSREFSVDLQGVVVPDTLDVLHERKVKVRYTPSAPGARTGALEVTTDDPRNSVARAPLSSGESNPFISVDPLFLSFGDVEQGASLALPVRITNAGFADLRVTPTLTGSSDFSVSATPLTIAPNATVSLDTTYTPSDPGSDQGTLVLMHNDPSQSAIEVALSGGAEPGIDVSPLGVQFTNVVQGRTADAEVVLTNTGFGELELGAIAFGTQAGEFNADLTVQNVPAAGTRLRRGQSARFTVRYSKTNVGNPTGIVYIASNDPDPSQNPFPLYVLAKDGVGDLPPVAEIACSNCSGTTLQSTLPAVVRLDGAQSRDPENQTLLYFWSLLAIPAQSQAVLDNPQSAAPTFSADVAGTYRVGLLVQDPAGQQSPRVTRDLVVMP
jgi:hypothetical protein